MDPIDAAIPNSPVRIQAIVIVSMDPIILQLIALNMDLELESPRLTPLLCKRKSNIIFVISIISFIITAGIDVINYIVSVRGDELGGTQSHSHTVTQSHSHIVTQSHSHTLTQSHSHTITQSNSHMVTQSHSHIVTQSHSHTVTQSHSQIVTQSRSHTAHGHTVTQSHSHMCTVTETFSKKI